MQILELVVRMQDHSMQVQNASVGSVGVPPSLLAFKSGHSAVECEVGFQCVSPTVGRHTGAACASVCVDVWVG